MLNEKLHQQLTTLIGLFKEGEGRTPILNKKAARLVMVGVVNLTEGGRPCDPPWDIGEDEASDIAAAILEKMQEVADARRRQQLMAATFYFVSDDQKRTPIAGSSGQPYARSCDMTIDPVGGADSEYAQTSDLRRKENQDATALGQAFQAMAKANDILASHCSTIATSYAEAQHEHRLERAEMRGELASVHTAMNQLRVDIMTEKDTSLDRELKRAVTLSEIESKKGMTEIRQSFMKALTPAVGDIAALGSSALAQYAGKAMGVAITPAQKQIMDSFKPILAKPERLMQVFQGLGLSEEEQQSVLNGVSLMHTAEKMTEPTDNAKRAMTGVRGPALTVAKFRTIPSVAEVLRRANASETQATVAGGAK